MRQAIKLLECCMAKGLKTIDIDIVMSAVKADMRDSDVIWRNCKCPVCGHSRSEARANARQKMREERIDLRAKHMRVALLAETEAVDERYADDMAEFN